MLDLILIYLPLLVFVAPFLAWLDKAKRFSHRRKFYVERLEAAHTYIDKYHNKPLCNFEKDCAAQALVGSEKIDHRQVDYVIEHYPKRFFIMINKLITARHLINTQEIGGKIVLWAESTKKQLKKTRIFIGLAYLSSLIVLYANQIALFIIKNISFLKPIEVNDGWLLTGFFIQIIGALLIALYSWFLFWEIDAAIEVYDELNIQHRP